MQYFINSLLSDLYNTTIANDAKAAQDYLQSTSTLPDLILSDVMMPKMDGMQLLAWLKSEEKMASIPVIMFTAKVEEENKLEALTIGVDDYLTKPFSPKELLARVNNLVHHAASRNEPIEGQEKELATEEEIGFQGLKEKDKVWIKKVEQIAKEMIEDKALDAPNFAKAANVSLSSLKRKLKQITGLSVTLYLREIRLQKARNLLERGVFGTIAETAYAAAFGSPYYFSKVYEARFGKKLSDYFR
jgi:DNA-binding response OmpR family regulator